MSDRERAFGRVEAEDVGIEAGSPSAENAAFVLLGALCAVLVFVHLAGLLP